MRLLASLLAGLTMAAPVPVDQPGLHWTACGAYQCTSAQVPLDYRDPSGPKITLQLRRAPATGHRIGTLFLYAGGPGSSGWDWVDSFATSAIPEIRQRFDILGYDPRGVHRSQAVSCLDQPAYSAEFFRPATFDNAVRSAREWDAACQKQSGALLPFIGTAYQARDLDLLRAAVGDPKLTFFGNSYATFVGTVYANLFPLHTRALVLDSGYDPIKYADDPYAYDYGQYRSTDQATHRFLDWCAGHRTQCPFDGKLSPLLHSLDQHPVGAVNGATILSNLTYRLNSGTRRWASLGADLHAAESHTGPLMYAIGPEDTTFNAVNVSVECADRVFPPGLAELRRRLARVAADFPLTAPDMAFGPPAYDQTHAPACLQWPAARLSRYAGPWRADGSAPILVSGNTGDPDTPYADSVTLAHTLAHGHLITWVGEGHTARRKSACIERYMYAYLLHLTVPPAGTTCHDAPMPG